MQNDWRLNNQMEYLYESELLYSTFKEDEKNDHVHCEFCWATFSDDLEDLHNGYCTLDKYRWICQECYDDFKDMFKWRLVENK